MTNEDYWYTGFKSEYEVNAGLPAELRGNESRDTYASFARRSAGSAYSSRGSADLAPNASETVEDEYRRRAANPENEVPYMLASGINRIESDIRLSMQHDDVEAVREKSAYLQDWIDANKDSLSDWSVNGARSGEFGKRLSDKATSLLDDSYRDKITLNSMSKDGKLVPLHSLRTYLDDTSPESIDREAMRAKRDYAFTDESAASYVDRHDEYYGAFGIVRSIRNDASAALASSRGEAKSSAKDLIATADSFTSFIGSDLGRHRAVWDANGGPAAASEYYRNFYSFLGSDIGEANADQYFKQYINDMNSPGFNSRAWFSDLQRSVDKLIPKDVRVFTDSKGQVHREEVNSPYISKGKAQTALARGKELAEMAHFDGFSMTSPAFNAALGKQLDLQGRIEKHLGMSFDELGLNDVATAAALYSSSGNQSHLSAISGAKGTADFLGHVSSVDNAIHNSLGFVPDDGGDLSFSNRDDGMAFRVASETAVATLIRSFIEGKRDGRFLDPDSFRQELSGTEEGPTGTGRKLVDALADGFITDLGTNRDFANELAKRTVLNFISGRSEKMSDMLMSMGGYRMYDKATGSSVPSSPDQYVDLVTGVSTRAKPVVTTGDLGGLSVNNRGPSSYSTLAELDSIASGKSSLVPKDAAESEAVREFANSLRNTITRAITSGDGHADTAGMSSQAGKLYAVNLKHSIPGIPSDFLDWAASGAMFDFLESRDKFSGISAGDRAVYNDAVNKVESLAKFMESKEYKSLSDEQKAATCGILTTLSLSLNTRGGVGSSAPEQLEATERVMESFGTQVNWLDMSTFVGPPLGNVAGRWGRDFLQWSKSKLPARWQKYPEAFYDKVMPYLSKVGLKDGFDRTDSDAQRELVNLHGRVKTLFGNINPYDAMCRLGYTPSPLGEKKDDVEYGNILQAYAAFSRANPSTDGIAKGSPSPVSNPTAPLSFSRPETTGSAEARRILAASYSRDDQFRQLDRKLQDAVSAHAVSKDSAAVMYSRLRSDVVSRYESSGFDAAMRYVNTLGSKRWMYLPSAVNRIGPDGKQRTDTIIRPIPMDDAERNAYADKYFNGDASMLEVLDAENRAKYLRNEEEERDIRKERRRFDTQVQLEQLKDR